MTEEELKRLIRSQNKALQSKARTAVRPAPRPIQASTIGMPDPVDWTQRAKDIVTGLSTFSQRLNPVGAIIQAREGAKRQAELGPLPEELGPAMGQMMMSAFQPEMQALETVSDIAGPATGLLASKFESGVNPRYAALRAQGVGPFQAMHQAYDLAVDAGEIPLWEQILFEGLTDPLELLPGGLALGGARRLATGAAKLGRFGARTGSRAGLFDEFAGQVDPVFEQQPMRSFADIRVPDTGIEPPKVEWKTSPEALQDLQKEIEAGTLEPAGPRQRSIERAARSGIEPPQVGWKTSPFRRVDAGVGMERAREARELRPSVLDMMKTGGLGRSRALSRQDELLADMYPIGREQTVSGSVWDDPDTAAMAILADVDPVPWPVSFRGSMESVDRSLRQIPMSAEEVKRGLWATTGEDLTRIDPITGDPIPYRGGRDIGSSPLSPKDWTDPSLGGSEVVDEDMIYNMIRSLGGSGVVDEDMLRRIEIAQREMAELDADKAAKLARTQAQREAMGTQTTMTPEEAAKLSYDDPALQGAQWMKGVAEQRLLDLFPAMEGSPYTEQLTKVVGDQPPIQKVLPEIDDLDAGAAGPAGTPTRPTPTPDVDPTGVARRVPTQEEWAEGFIDQSAIPEATRKEIIDPDTGEQMASGVNILNARLDDIALNPLYQPRYGVSVTEGNILRSQVDQIKNNFDPVQLDPIRLRYLPEGSEKKYELVTGHHRLQAVNELGHDTIISRVDNMTDQQALDLASADNLASEQLDAVGKIQAIQRVSTEGRTPEDVWNLLGPEARKHDGYTLLTKKNAPDLIKILELPTEILDEISRLPGSLFSIHQAKHLAKWAVDSGQPPDQVQAMYNYIRAGDKTSPFTANQVKDLLDKYGYNPRVLDEIKSNQAQMFGDIEGGQFSPILQEIARGVKEESRLLGELSGARGARTSMLAGRQKLAGQSVPQQDENIRILEQQLEDFSSQSESNIQQMLGMDVETVPKVTDAPTVPKEQTAMDFGAVAPSPGAIPAIEPTRSIKTISHPMGDTWSSRSEFTLKQQVDELVQMAMDKEGLYVGRGGRPFKWVVDTEAPKLVEMSDDELGSHIRELKALPSRQRDPKLGLAELEMERRTKDLPPVGGGSGELTPLELKAAHESGARFLTVPKTKDVLETNFIPNWTRNLGRRLVSIAGVKQAGVGQQINPSLMAENPMGRGVIAYKKLQDSAQAAATAGVAPLRALGRVWDIDQNGNVIGIRVKPGVKIEKSSHILEVLSKPDNYMLTRGQQQWVDIWRLLRDDRLLELNKANIDLSDFRLDGPIGQQVLDIDLGRGGQEYFPRIALMDKDLLGNQKNVNIVGREMTQEQIRQYDTIAEAVADGQSYMIDPNDIVESTLRASHQMLVDKDFVDWMVDEKLLSARRGLGQDVAPPAKGETLLDVTTPGIGKRFRGIIVDQETKNALDEIVRDVGSPLLGRFENIGNMSRFLQTGIDPGYLLIQGQVLASSHPKIFAKSAHLSLKAFLQPETLQKYLRDNADVVQEMISSGSSPFLASEYASAATTGFLYDWAGRGGARGLAGNVAQKASAAFNAFMDVARIELYKAMSKDVKLNFTGVDRAKELSGLSDVVDHMVGISSSRSLGVSASRRQLEGAFLLYAPRYRRAVGALMVDAMQGGTRGKVARRGLAHLAASAMFFMGGISFLMGVRDPANRDRAPITGKATPVKGMEWLPFDFNVWPIFNPTDPRFMTIRLGKTEMGLGGAFVSNIKMLARFATGLSEGQGVPEKMSNLAASVGKTVRGSASPATSLGWAAMTNTDYFGDPVWNMRGVPAQVLERVLPFWLAPYLVEPIEEAKSWSPSDIASALPGPERGPVSALGAREFPANPRNIVSQDLFQQPYGAMPEDYQQDIVDQIAGSQYNLPESDFSRERERRLQELKELGERTDLTPQEMAISFYKIENESRGYMRKAREDAGFRSGTDADLTENQKALEQVYALYKTYDPKMYDAQYEILKESWGNDPEKIAFVDRNTNVKPIPEGLYLKLPQAVTARFDASLKSREDHLRQIGRDELIGPMRQAYIKEPETLTPDIMHLRTVERSGYKNIMTEENKANLLKSRMPERYGPYIERYVGSNDSARRNLINKGTERKMYAAVKAQYGYSERLLEQQQLQLLQQDQEQGGVLEIILYYYGLHPRPSLRANDANFLRAVDQFKKNLSLQPVG